MISGGFNEMNIQIKKLTPKLVEDYIHFFDVTPHDKYVDEHKCYSKRLLSM